MCYNTTIKNYIQVFIPKRALLHEAKASEDGAFFVPFFLQKEVIICSDHNEYIKNHNFRRYQ